MLKIRRQDRLVFNMAIPMPERNGLYTETGPSLLKMLETDVCKFYFYKHGIPIRHTMMTLWYGNTFQATGPLRWESTGEHALIRGQ